MKDYIIDDTEFLEQVEKEEKEHKEKLKEMLKE